MQTRKKRRRIPAVAAAFVLATLNVCAARSQDIRSAPSADAIAAAAVDANMALNAQRADFVTVERPVPASRGDTNSGDKKAATFGDQEADAPPTIGSLAFETTPRTESVRPTLTSELLRPVRPQIVPGEDLIDFVMYQLEGEGFIAHDNGVAPSKWGIKASPLNGVNAEEVRHLTPETAYPIYERVYYYGTGIDKLPLRAQIPAYNAAVNFGPAFAREIIAETGGDPQALLQANADKYAELLRQPKNQQYRNNWERRMGIITYLTNHTGSEPLLLSTVLHHRDYVLRPPLLDQDPEQLAADNQTPLQMPVLTSAAGPVDMGTSGIEKGLLLTLAGLFGIAYLLGTKKPKPRPLPIQNKKVSPLKTGKPEAVYPSLGHQAGVLPTSVLSTSEKPVAPAFTNYRASGLTEQEYGALQNVFGKYNPARRGRDWQIDYPDRSQVIVQTGNIQVQGDGGVRDSLKYAARAWNNQCVLKGNSPETIARMIAAAQDLVNSGDLAEGFSIQTDQGVTTLRVNSNDNLKAFRQQRDIVQRQIVPFSVPPHRTAERPSRQPVPISGVRPLAA